MYYVVFLQGLLYNAASYFRAFTKGTGMPPNQQDNANEIR